MKKVYLAGPLNAKDAVGYIKNVSIMAGWDEELRLNGYAVYNPSLDLITGIYSGEMEYDDYLKSNMAWIEVADCVLLVPGWEDSKGANIEKEYANKLGKPVFETVDDLKIWDSMTDVDVKDYKEYSVALMQELWDAFTNMIQECMENCTCGGCELPTDDNFKMKMLRRELYDFGVRGIYDMPEKS